MQRDQVTALILAGGKATRMGRRRQARAGDRGADDLRAPGRGARARAVAEIIVSSPPADRGPPHRARIRWPAPGRSPASRRAWPRRPTPVAVRDRRRHAVHPPRVRRARAVPRRRWLRRGRHPDRWAGPSRCATVMRVAAWAEPRGREARRRAAEGVIAFDRRVRCGYVGSRRGELRRGRSAPARAAQRQCTGRHVPRDSAWRTRVALQLAAGRSTGGLRRAALV